METQELEMQAETPTPDRWKTFDDNQALLSHIFAQKLSEEIVKVPEWDIEVLCRALTGEQRVKVQIKAFDEKTKRVDYRSVFHLVLVHGCYNPVNGNKIFTESQAEALMKQTDGAAIERLSLVVLRLSGILSSDQENARKN